MANVRRSAVDLWEENLAESYHLWINLFVLRYRLWREAMIMVYSSVIWSGWELVFNLEDDVGHTIEGAVTVGIVLSIEAFRMEFETFILYKVVIFLKMNIFEKWFLFLVVNIYYLFLRKIFCHFISKITNWWLSLDSLHTFIF